MNITAIIANLDADTRNALTIAVNGMLAETGGEFVSYIGTREINSVQAGHDLIADNVPYELASVCEDTMNRKPLVQVCAGDEFRVWLCDNKIEDVVAADQADDDQAEEIEISEPINAHTGVAYSGKNVAELMGAQEAGGYSTSVWCTFNQALEMGRCVSKGQKAAARVIKVVAGKKATDDDKPAKGKKGKGFGMRSYSVFNIAQTQEMTEEEIAAHAERKAAKKAAKG